jgi:outer membrane protein OmpA-like peptidoglycan-associated protein
MRVLCALLVCAAITPALAQTPEKTTPVELTAPRLAKALNEAGSVIVRGIRFDSGTATIRSESAPLFAAIAEVLKNDRSLKLGIEGHTDNAGTAAANLRLSQARAAAVRDRLIRMFGIAADRLTATGFGDARPIASNSTEGGREQNRRVELVKILSPAPGAKTATAQAGPGEWTGRVTTGMMAAGGETTGIILVTAEDQLELQPADPAMRQRLQDLNGKTVTIRGTLQIARGVEIKTRRIIKVADIRN